MDKVSPIQAGFRRVFAQPGLALAEIAWRWSFGVAALALVAASVLLYLDTIPVSEVELLALRSRSPWLVADALAHIFRGSGVKLVKMFLVLAPALAVLWIAVASLGRGATLAALFEPNSAMARQASLVGLHFLRAALGLATFIGYIGAAIIAQWAAAMASAGRPATFLLVFAVVVLLVGILHSRIAWFLLLATLFAVRDRRYTFVAIAEAIRLFRRRSADFYAVGPVFLGIKLFLFCAATAFGLVPVLLIGRVPGWFVIAMVGLVTVIYFAAADFLFVARVAAYVAVVEDDRAPTPALPPLPLEGPSNPVAPLFQPAGPELAAEG